MNPLHTGEVTAPSLLNFNQSKDFIYYDGMRLAQPSPPRYISFIDKKPDPNKDMQDRLRKVIDIKSHKRDLQESVIN